MENFDRKGFVYRKDWTYIPIKTNTKHPAVKEYKSNYIQPPISEFEKHDNIAVMIEQKIYNCRF